MDEETRRMLDALFQTIKDQHRMIAGLQARSAINTHLLMRLVYATDLLSDMSHAERDEMNQVLDGALSAADLELNPAALEAYVELVRLRLATLNG